MDGCLGMGLNNHQLKPLLDAQLRRNPQLPDAPDGPLLDSFSALELAQAIESEVYRAAGAGLTKLRLDMNFKDASDLASFLRRAAMVV